MFGGVPLNGDTGNVEQGAHQRRPAQLRTFDKHPGRTGDAGTAQEIEQDRLGLIVTVMGQPKPVCPTRSEDAMPQAPRRAFQPLSAIARHRNPDDLERHAAAMTEILAKPCPIIGALAQSMMHMEGRQADGAVLLYCQAIQGM